MTRSVLIVSLLLMFSLSANKQDEAYHKANKALKTGQYQEALEGYESLTPQGPAVLYNRGIALYHLQRYGKALAAWSKAEQHASPGLLKKIQYNKSEAYSKLDLTAPAAWRSTVLMIQSYFSLFLLQVFFLITWLGWWFASYIHITVIKKYRIFLLLISIFCGCLLACKYWVQQYKQAVIVVSGAKLFTGPNVEFDTVTEIKEGEPVLVVQEEDPWYKVNYHNTHGWIEGADLEQIN